MKNVKKDCMDEVVTEMWRNYGKPCSAGLLETHPSGNVNG